MNRKELIVVIVVALFSGFIGSAVYSWLGPVTGSTTGVTQGKLIVSADDDPVLGSKNAPLTIVEFSDFQCPFCRKFWTETFEQINTNYVKTGKVKFVYRDFPLTQIHPAAVPSALAATCANEEGKFWEMHDKIFSEQNILDSGSKSGPVAKTVTFGESELKKWAKETGLDSTKFDACLDSEKYIKEVENDFDQGNGYGVDGTPAFFIGNEKKGFTKLSGAQPFEAFKQSIDAQLK